MNLEEINFVSSDEKLMKQKTNWPKLKLGISSCLLGNRVRHNGEHKANDWILNQLSPFVSWIPICPELEMGLGVPRETMRLNGTPDNPRLVTVNTKQDLTQSARQTIDRILRKDPELAKLALDGYIFKKDSPTCGLERVKVYGPSGIPAKSGIGLFAKSLQEKYPKIPMIEEGRLSVPSQREFFLIQLFIFGQFSRLPKTIKDLQKFHQDHKLQLMAYAPGKYPLLGRLAANSEKQNVSDIFMQYEELLSQVIRKPLTIKKYCNVFEHILGYFKKYLDQKEKLHMISLLKDYRKSRIPLASLSTLFRFLVDKYEIEYLAHQSVFFPYPEEILTGSSI